MRRIISKMLCVMFAFLCVSSLTPASQSLAAVSSITEGYSTRASAYNWGRYSDSNVLYITLPEGQEEMWVKFTLPSQSSIFIRSSYRNEYEGMYLKLYQNSSTNTIDEKYSPDDVKNADTILPFLALDCDNMTSSTQTYYVRVNRGDYVGSMFFTYSLNNRIKTGNGTFSFSGTASNTGNTELSLSGVDSSVLSLNLLNETKIPPNAILTSVTSSGTQSPSQGNVHHKLLPSSSTSSWFTSTVVSATKGFYDISVDNNYKARQLWQFKYNVLASAKSTMRNVSILLYWEYDMADTNYTIYKY